MAKGTRKQKFDMDAIRCKFGNLSVGPEKVTISVTVERDGVASRDLEPVVVGGRLEAQLTCDPHGQEDAAGQATMVATAVVIESVADCPSLQIRPSKLGFRLAFAAGSVDVRALAGIAQRNGTVSLTRIGDSGVDERDE